MPHRAHQTRCAVLYGAERHFCLTAFFKGKAEIVRALGASDPAQPSADVL
jgi:hypothetical protein